MLEIGQDFRRWTVCVIGLALDHRMARLFRSHSIQGEHSSEMCLFENCCVIGMTRCKYIPNGARFVVHVELNRMRVFFSSTGFNKF